jgi:glucan 1,3-beta-glucosidase
VLSFAAAFAAGPRRDIPVSLWLAVTANALAGGLLIGWAVENVGLESLGVGLWVRSLTLVAAAILTPIVASAAVTTQKRMPPLSAVLSVATLRKSDRLTAALGLMLVVAIVLSLQVALGLVFDPRYKDFPFAPLTAAVVPLFVHGMSVARTPGSRGAAETAAAVLLALSVIYIVPNETFANWQSLWLCAIFAALALTLSRVRGAPD